VCRSWAVHGGHVPPPPASGPDAPVAPGACGAAEGVDYALRMLWVILYSGLAVGSLLVLGVVGFRLFRDVRELSRAVAAASRRIAEASAQLEQAAAGRRQG
jgi:hypothetical protein